MSRKQLVPLDMNSSKITNLATPTNATDAATKDYVDTNAGGSGDVTGPASSTDNAVARFDSTTGKILQNSGVTIDDTNILTATGLSAQQISATGTQGVFTDKITSSSGSTSINFIDSIKLASTKVVQTDTINETTSAAGVTVDGVLLKDGFIAASAVPTLNQNTTGSAATLTTARTIDGQSFNGSANITVIAPGTHAATSKTTPVNADEIPLVDSASSNILKKLTWANLKATFKSYYDSVSATLTNKTLTGGLVTAAPTTDLGIANKGYVDTGLAGKVSSTTTAKLTASTTTPTSPSAGDVWIKTDEDIVDTVATASAAKIVTSMAQETPSGSVNGSNTVFTTLSPFTSGTLRVYLNGQRLKSGASYDYTEDAGLHSFTMNYAPAAGDVILVDYSIVATTTTGANVFINQETPTGSINGSNTAFSLSRSYVSGSLQVYINGLLQAKTTHVTEVSASSGTFSLDVAPATGDIVRVSYQYAASTGGNSQTVNGITANTTPTANQLYPISSGLPLQVVSATYSSMVTGTTILPYDDTIPQNTEGDEYMSLSITPKMANSHLVIEANIQLSHSAVTNISAALFRDSGVNAIAAGEVTEETVFFVRNVPILVDVVSGSTSSTTFKIRAGGSSAGTTTFNGTNAQRRFGGIPTSWIKITEYAG